LTRPCDNRVRMLLLIKEIATAASHYFGAFATMTRPYDNSIGQLLRSKMKLRVTPSNVVQTELRTRPCGRSIRKQLVIDERAKSYSLECSTDRAWD